VKFLLLSLAPLVFASCAKDIEETAFYTEPTPDLSPLQMEASAEPDVPVKPANRIANRQPDGLRLPDMLTLPQDDQLRSAAVAPKDGKATVIVRPPQE
jgi:hypothetical protein